MSLFFQFIKLCLPRIIKMGVVIGISMQMLFKLSTIIPYLNYSFFPMVFPPLAHFSQNTTHTQLALQHQN